MITRSQMGLQTSQGKKVCFNGKITITPTSFSSLPCTAQLSRLPAVILHRVRPRRLPTKVSFSLVPLFEPVELSLWSAKKKKKKIISFYEPTSENDQPLTPCVQLPTHRSLPPTLSPWVRQVTYTYRVRNVHRPSPPRRRFAPHTPTLPSILRRSHGYDRWPSHIAGLLLTSDRVKVCLTFITHSALRVFAS